MTGSPEGPAPSSEPPASEPVGSGAGDPPGNAESASSEYRNSELVAAEFGDELLGGELAHELAESLSRLEEYAARSRSKNTLRAYAADLEDFRHWCERYGRTWLPAAPETVALYLGSHSEELALATLERRLASINAAHKDEGYAPPATVSEGPLRRAWRGIAREKTRRQDKAEPLMAEDLRGLVAALPRYGDAGYEEPLERGTFRGRPGELTLTSLRDRALLLTGWAGALRRSELVRVRTEDLELVAGEGYTLYIQRSKQDQTGRGLYKGLPYGTRAESCPVLALRTWTGAASAALEEPLEGPVFRRFYRGESVGKKAMTAQYVSRILKEHAARIGLDASEYSAHSLRSGFITQAIRKGKRERRVKEHSGHASWEAFGEYVKRAGTFEENPAKDIGI